MISKIKLYFKTVFNSLRNKPTIIVRERVVQVPFTQTQIQKLKAVFPVKRIGNTPVRELLMCEGHQQVIEFIERLSKRGDV